LTASLPDKGATDLLEAAPCGILSFGDDGIVRSANSGMGEIVGRDHPGLIGRPIEEILTVGSRIFYQTHWFPLLRLHGRADEIFLLLRDRAGEEVGALVNAARHGDAYICVFMRVRERQKYEGELLRARRVAEEARNGMEARQRELENANHVLESQAVELEQQQQQLHEQAVELETTADELQALNAELEDRTAEAERLRAIAEDANAAKSRFLAVMSHELRTPLNAIAGYVQILQMGVPGPVNDEQTEMLERVGRSGRHLLRLINDVLNLARIESGYVDYSISDVPAESLVAWVTPMVEPQLRERGVAFVVDVNPGHIVRADPDKAQQVLLNLLSNAVKFTPAGGSVIVRSRMDPDPRAADTVFLEVTDTGIGIPLERQDEIFFPFVQVDDTRTRATEGTGLGLAISRDLARGMGGDLAVRSEPGAGSTFTLSLPGNGAGSPGKA